MKRDIVVVCNSIMEMDNQLRSSLLVKNGKIQNKKLWENTHIKKQIDRRNAGDKDFPVQDHIRAMVYSMLSSGISWERVENSIDEKTGRITAIDEIFHRYDPQYLLSCSGDDLADQIKEIGCASYSTRKQMNGLIHTNIGKLLKLQEKYESIDRYYQKYIEMDNSMKLLVRELSCLSSEDKFVQMGEPLIAEYLRNVGYDLAKPDRHICRILGRNYLGCSEQEEVPVYEAFDLIRKLSEYMGRKTIAEVDYILWSYCAVGYGAVCSKNNPRCGICVAKEICSLKGGV